MFLHRPALHLYKHDADHPDLHGVLHRQRNIAGEEARLHFFGLQLDSDVHELDGNIHLVRQHNSDDSHRFTSRLLSAVAEC